MPRDSSGNYTLPAGNPVVTGTTVSSSWANTTLSDIATVLTASLDRSGNGGMLVGFKLTDGAVGSPGLTFTNEPTTGFYRIQANQIGMAIGGVNYISFTIPSFTVNGPNMNIAAPNAGNTLTLGTVAGQYGLVINSASFAGISLSAFQGILGTNDTYLYNAQTTFDTVFGARAANTIHIQTNAIDRLLIGSSGAITVEQPTGALTALTITANPGSYGIAVGTTSGSVSAINAGCGPSGYIITFNDGSGGNGFIGFGSGHQVQFGSTSNYDVQFLTNNVIRVGISATGQVTINPPASGQIALSVTGVNGTHSVQITDSASNLFNAGFLEVPQISTSVSRPTVLSDNGKHIYQTVSTTQTIDGTLAYPIGATLTFINMIGGATMNIGITTGSTLYWAGTGGTGTRSLAQFGKATAIKVTATAWLISGVNLT